jgi:hypothetical protein
MIHAPEPSEEPQAGSGSDLDIPSDDEAEEGTFPG